jgi:hypothetical protein
VGEEEAGKSCMSDARCVADGDGDGSLGGC